MGDYIWSFNCFNLFSFLNLDKAVEVCQSHNLWKTRSLHRTYSFWCQMSTIGTIRFNITTKKSVDVNSSNQI